MHNQKLNFQNFNQNTYNSILPNKQTKINSLPKSYNSNLKGNSFSNLDSKKIHLTQNKSFHGQSYKNDHVLSNSYNFKISPEYRKKISKFSPIHTFTTSNGSNNSYSKISEHFQNYNISFRNDSIKDESLRQELASSSDDNSSILEHEIFSENSSPRSIRSQKIYSGKIINSSGRQESPITDSVFNSEKSLDSKLDSCLKTKKVSKRVFSCCQIGQVKSWFLLSLTLLTLSILSLLISRINQEIENFNNAYAVIFLDSLQLLIILTFGFIGILFSKKTLLSFYILLQTTLFLVYLILFIVWQCYRIMGKSDDNTKNQESTKPNSSNKSKIWNTITMFTCSYILTIVFSISSLALGLLHLRTINQILSKDCSGNCTPRVELIGRRDNSLKFKIDNNELVG